jgi:hypothetical protein
LAVMRRRNQRVGTIHLRITSMRVTSTGNRSDHPLRHVKVTRPDIGEEDDLERCHRLARVALGARRGSPKTRLREGIRRER